MKQIFFFLFSFICCACSFAQKLFPIEIKGKWGYMNAEGKMKIPARFDYADDFSEGYAVAALNRQPCIIDETGKITVDTSLYQFIGGVSEGLVSAVDFQGRRFYITPQGKVMITLPADIYEARPFKRGIAVIAKQVDIHENKFGRDISTLGYRFGFIDKSGKMVTEFIYDDADDIQSGVSRVRQGTRFGLVNSKGETVAKPVFNNIGIFSEGKAMADENGKYGYIDTMGVWVIKPQFEFVYPFSEGMAGVLVAGKYGFIDESGVLKVPGEYQAVKPFGEGKAPVMKENKWGFINKKGEWVIRNVFDDAGMFSEGLCPVLYKRKWGFIGPTGEVVIPADFDAAGSFHDGVADVMVRDINFYINKRGVVLPVLK